MTFDRGFVKYLLSPEGSAVDFYAAVDIVFSEHTSEHGLAAGLVFGHTGEGESATSYQLFLSANKTWALSRQQGWDNAFVLSPSRVDMGQVPRLAVVVEEGSMRFFVDDRLVGEWRDRDFRGGEVGLLVASNPGTVSVEFDRFELRRSPGQ